MMAPKKVLEITMPMVTRGMPGIGNKKAGVLFSRICYTSFHADQPLDPFFRAYRVRELSPSGYANCKHEEPFEELFIEKTINHVPGDGTSCVVEPIAIALFVS